MAAQVRRVADFPHAGDLIVNSAVYADGSVAAFEELVGSHGGLGGEQTDAFIFHPVDMIVTPTKNAVEVFSMLDARRGLGGSDGGAPVAAPSPARAVKPWAPEIAWHGLRDWRHWLACALRSLLLESAVYGQVARDPSATGPAVLIAVGALFLHAALSGQVNSPAGRVQEIAGWGLVG